MSDMNEGIFSCRNICWIVGGLLGLVAFLLIGGLWGLIVGVVLAVAVALVLQRLFCAGSGAAAAGAAVAGGTTTIPAAAPAADGAAEKVAAAQAEADAKAARDKAEAEKAAAQAAAAKKAAEEKAAAEAESARKVEAEKAAAQASAAKETAEAKAGAGVGSRPEALSGPRGGTADDLKLIKGVGPALEKLCNDLGFYHFDQIANWSASEVAWVDENLKGFKGRVSRDGWVEQAKTLASGAETEFSKRASKSGMYDA